MKTCNYRIGIGYDIHKFTVKRKLILGGVKIPFSKGLDGHSDADVLLHSICDAMLGAAGMEDIGHQFPNTDLKYKNISSLILLKKSLEIIKSKKWKIANVDCTLILQEPKIYPFINEMKKNISKILKCKNISVKATTPESIGDLGNKKGCASYSVVLLYK